MKRKTLLSVWIAAECLGLLLSLTPAAAQQIYRCVSAGGVSEYINNTKEAQSRSCKAMTGGNVTVVQGTSTSGSSGLRPAPRPSSSLSPAPQRSDGSTEQRARDNDSRAILEAELRKSEARLAELEAEYKGGEPDKQGIESRNYQRYLDRVAELKGNISRSQSDIAGIKREIARLPIQN